MRLHESWPLAKPRQQRRLQPRLLLTPRLLLRKPQPQPYKLRRMPRLLRLPSRLPSTRRRVHLLRPRPPQQLARPPTLQLKQRQLRARPPTLRLNRRQQTERLLKLLALQL